MDVFDLNLMQHDDLQPEDSVLLAYTQYTVSVSKALAKSSNMKDRQIALLGAYTACLATTMSSMMQLDPQDTMDALNYANTLHKGYLTGGTTELERVKPEVQPEYKPNWGES